MGRKLIFFIGNSGSGKDSVMKMALQILTEEDIPASIVKRWITRPQHESEDFISVSKEKFENARNEGYFTLSWHIYENWYGEPKNIHKELVEGVVVLCNVSRSVTFEGKKKYPLSKLVLVDVPMEIAKERITKRGREKGRALKDRIHRMDESINHPIPDLVLKNDCHLSDCTDTLLEFLKAL